MLKSLKNNLAILYDTILGVSAFLILFSITKPFQLNIDMVIFILIGGFLEFGFAKNSLVEKMTALVITLSLLTLFSNIQTLIIGISFIYTLSSVQSSGASLKNFFRGFLLGIPYWSQIVVTGYFLFAIKNHFNININQGCPEGLTLLLFLLYVVFNFLFLNLRLALTNGEKAIKLNLENLFVMVYIIFAGFFAVYVYHFMGLAFTILLYLLAIPVQKANESNKIYKLQEKYIYKDDLTDAYNRRFFIRELNEKIKTKQEFALIMLDIDDFKSVNDTHGHVVGDRFLKLFTNTLKDSVRKGDLIIRFGGDEFCILIQDTNKVDSILNRLNENLKKVTLSVGDKVLRINASMGVYCHKDKQLDIDQIIQIVDDKMYERKAERKAKRKVIQCQA